MKNISSTPGLTANQVLFFWLGHSCPIVLELFDVTRMCHECQICSRFHQIWKMILEMTFSGHRFESWFEYLVLAVLAKLHENAFDEHQMLRSDAAMTTSPYGTGRWGKFVQWVKKLWSRKPCYRDLPLRNLSISSHNIDLLYWGKSRPCVERSNGQQFCITIMNIGLCPSLEAWNIVSRSRSYF